MCEGAKATYGIQIDDMLLPGFCSSRGNVPVNITVAPDMINHFRNSCQCLIICISNMVKVPGASTHPQVLVKEPQPMSHFSFRGTKCDAFNLLFFSLYLDLCAGENKGTSSLFFVRQGGKSKIGKYQYRCFP